jgi:hypothetical protein
MQHIHTDAHAIAQDQVERLRIFEHHPAGASAHRGD